MFEKGFEVNRIKIRKCLVHLSVRKRDENIFVRVLPTTYTDALILIEI